MTDPFAADGPHHPRSLSLVRPPHLPWLCVAPLAVRTAILVVAQARPPPCDSLYRVAASSSQPNHAFAVEPSITRYPGVEASPAVGDQSPDI